MKLSQLAVSVVAGGALLMLSACGGSSSNGASADSSAAGGGLTIGVSFDIVNDIRNAELASLEQAAKSKGDKIVFVSADSDAQKQAAQIQDLIQVKKVDALVVIAVNNDQIAASVALAKSSKVPFIAVDRAVAGSESVGFQITGDAVADGKLAAKEALAARPDPVIIQLVGALTDKNAVGRRDGFKEGVESGGAKVSAEVPTDWDPAKALDGTANALQSNPNVNTIFIPSDYLLPSVLSALKAAGKLEPVGHPKHVTLVTIDGDQNGCKAIADKLLDGDIVTPVADFGAKAVEAAHLLKKKDRLDPAEVKVAGFALNQGNFEAKKATAWGCAGK